MGEPALRPQRTVLTCHDVTMLRPVESFRMHPLFSHPKEEVAGLLLSAFDDRLTSKFTHLTTGRWGRDIYEAVTAKGGVSVAIKEGHVDELVYSQGGRPAPTTEASERLLQDVMIALGLDDLPGLDFFFEANYGYAQQTMGERGIGYPTPDDSYNVVFVHGKRDDASFYATLAPAFSEIPDRVDDDLASRAALAAERCRLSEVAPGDLDTLEGGETNRPIQVLNGSAAIQVEVRFGDLCVPEGRLPRHGAYYMVDGVTGAILSRRQWEWCKEGELG